MPVPALAIKHAIAGKISTAWMVLATILVHGSLVTYLLRASPAPTETKLLLDPGPRHRCYHYQDLASNYSYISKVPECQPIKEYAGCPAWRYSSYNSGREHSELLMGTNVSMIDVTLVNNARARADPSEVSFDYYYPGCSIQRLSNARQYNLMNFDQWTFDYNVMIRSDNSTWADSKNTTEETWRRTIGQRYLATDFTYQYPASNCTTPNGTNASNSTHTYPGTSNGPSFSAACRPLERTIRVIHFDSLLEAIGPLSNTASLVSEPHSRPSTTTLLAPSIVQEDTGSRITLDFRALFQQYVLPSCNGSNPLPLWLHAHAISIVSGSQGLDSVMQVGNVSAVLRKGGKTARLWGAKSAGEREGRDGTDVGDGPSEGKAEEIFKVLSGRLRCANVENETLPSASASAGNSTDGSARGNASARYNLSPGSGARQRV